MPYKQLLLSEFYLPELGSYPKSSEVIQSFDNSGNLEKWLLIVQFEFPDFQIHTIPFINEYDINIDNNLSVIENFMMIYASWQDKLKDNYIEDIDAVVFMKLHDDIPIIMDMLATYIMEGKGIQSDPFKAKLILEEAYKLVFRSRVECLAHYMKMEIKLDLI